MKFIVTVCNFISLISASLFTDPSPNTASGLHKNIKPAKQEGPFIMMLSHKTQCIWHHMVLITT